MPQVARRPRITMLNNDGERHPKENSLAVISFVLGVVAFGLGLVVAAHLPATLIGLVGFPIALYSQMVSVTTGQRWLNVIGMIGSFVGAGVAIGNGGLSYLGGGPGAGAATVAVPTPNVRAAAPA